MAESENKKIVAWAKELGVSGPNLVRILQDAGCDDARTTVSVISSKVIDSVSDAVKALSSKSKTKKASPKKATTKSAAKPAAEEKESATGEAKAKSKPRKITTQAELAGGIKVNVVRTRPAQEAEPAPEAKKESAPAPVSTAKKEVAPPPQPKPVVVKPAAPVEKAEQEESAVEVKPSVVAPVEAKKEEVVVKVEQSEPVVPLAPSPEKVVAKKAEVKKEEEVAPLEKKEAKVETKAKTPASEKTDVSSLAVEKQESAAFKAQVEQPTEEFAARIARYQQQTQQRRGGGARPARAAGPGFTGSFGRPAERTAGGAPVRRGPGGDTRPPTAGFSGGPRPAAPPFAAGGGAPPAPGAAPGSVAGRPGGHGSGPRGSTRKRKRTPVQQKREEGLDPKQSVNRVMASLSKGSSRQHYDRRSGGSEVEEEKRELRVSDFITVSELAGLLGVSAAQVVAKCMELGMMVTINYRIDFDTIQLLASEFGYDAKLMDEYEDIEGEEEALIELAQVHRPPVVTVMGHADHGKTSLLDYVRKTRIAKGEAGGITQHVGAYQVETAKGPVTFLDTPGHEAFSAMRARGSHITDVVVLVVAADSMVMPQTIESIEHARSASVPIVVAITKCDLETANPDRIRSQLGERGIEVEQWGGKTSCVEVSSKSGLGMDTLLETLALEAEILNLKANPDMAARGVVIESRLDKGKGALATVLVQNGTLRVGDAFVVGNFAGRVRALFDETGELMKDVGPGRPCQIMGLDGAPFAGDRLTGYADEKEAREIASKRRGAAKERELRSHQRKQMSDVVAKSGELKVIIKADVDGSAEALTQELEKLSNKEVVVNIIQKAVGNINESDVQLAAASDAVIVAFHLLPAPAVRAFAERAGVEIKMYRVIYDCIEEFQGLVESKLKPIIREEVAGEAEVKQVYFIPKVGMIAGSVVTNGVVDMEAKLRIYRKGREVGVAKVSSLKRHQDNVTSVKVGLECGIGIDGFDDLQVDDTLAFFKEVKVKRTLKDVEA